MSETLQSARSTCVVLHIAPTVTGTALVGPNSGQCVLGWVR